jgi:hypothetical protein
VNKEDVTELWLWHRAGRKANYKESGFTGFSKFMLEEFPGI